MPILKRMAERILGKPATAGYRQPAPWTPFLRVRDLPAFTDRTIHRMLLDSI